MSEGVRALRRVGARERYIPTRGTSPMMRGSSERREFTGRRRILGAFACGLGGADLVARVVVENVAEVEREVGLVHVTVCGRILKLTILSEEEVRLLLLLKDSSCREKTSRLSPTAFSEVRLGSHRPRRDGHLSAGRIADLQAAERRGEDQNHHRVGLQR